MDQEHSVADEEPVTGARAEVLGRVNDVGYPRLGLGRGEPELIETGREITCGEYSGIRGFRDVYGRLEIEFKSDEEARQILELVRYANVHTQKPLTDGELRFIAKYPALAKQIMTMTPLGDPDWSGA